MTIQTDAETTARVVSSFMNDYFPPLSGMKYITEYFHNELKLYSSHETGYFHENMMFDANKDCTVTWSYANRHA